MNFANGASAGRVSFYANILKGWVVCLLGHGAGVGAFLGVLLFQVQAMEFAEIPGDRFCPDGQRLMSYSFATKNQARICNSLRNWTVARLAGDGSFSGPGNNCEIYKTDQRALGSSLCVPLKDYSSIRGVLLHGGFRTQNELNTMSEQDWRGALITELANRTLGSKTDYDQLDNASLAGAGSLFIHLRKTGPVSPSELANYSLEEMRQAIMYQLNRQTGIPISKLAIMSDLDLIELFLKG